MTKKSVSSGDPIVDPVAANRRTYRVKLVFGILFTVLLGLFLYFLFEGLGLTQNTFESSSTDPLVFHETPVNWWGQPVANIGLTLFTLAVVSIFYEFFLRRDSVIATESAIKKAGEGLGGQLTKDMIKFITGNETFVQNVLNREQRQELLRRLISANVDPSAEELASRMADQLSNDEWFRDYTVRYVACDKQEYSGPLPSRVLVDFTTNKKPSSFDVGFAVMPPDVDDPSLDDFNGAVYQLLAISEADAMNQLNSFSLTELTINEKPFKGFQTSQEDYFKKTTVPLDNLEDSKGGEYKVSFTMTWPSPKQGLVLHFEPNHLSKGMEVICDCSQSAFYAEHTERDLSVSWKTNDASGYEPAMISVRTTKWVLPTSAVGFVFLRRTH